MAFGAALGARAAGARSQEPAELGQGLPLILQGAPTQKAPDKPGCRGHALQRPPRSGRGSCSAQALRRPVVRLRQTSPIMRRMHERTPACV